MGVASLVLGIVGLVISFVPCLGMYGLFLTVPGVVLGFVGLFTAAKSNAPKGLAIAGLICSIIGTIVAGWQYKKLSEASNILQDAANAIGEEIKKSAQSGDTKTLDEAVKKVTDQVSKEAAEAGKKAAQEAAEAGKKAVEDAANKLKGLAK